MISINLLPKELDTRSQDISEAWQNMFLYIPAAIAGLIILIHLFLGGLLICKSLRYKSLNKKWAQLAQDRQSVDLWKRQHSISNQQAMQMSQMLKQRVTIADKCDALIEALPNGIWFNRLTLRQRQLLIEGSVVSLKKDKMRLLNLFLSRLKEDQPFFKDFIRLELGRVSMRTLSGFEIMDFVLEGDLNG